MNTAAVEHFGQAATANLQVLCNTCMTSFPDNVGQAQFKKLYSWVPEDILWMAWNTLKQFWTNINVSSPKIYSNSKSEVSAWKQHLQDFKFLWIFSMKGNEEVQ